MTFKSVGLTVAAIFVFGISIFAQTQSAKPATPPTAITSPEETMQVPEVARLKFQAIKDKRDERNKKVQELMQFIMADLDRQENDLAMKTCQDSGFVVQSCRYTVTDPGTGQPLPLEAWTMKGVKASPGNQDYENRGKTSPPKK